MALTKVTGGTISSTSSYQVGVITATKFVGPIETTDATISGGSITATDGTFSGNVSIAGTLTYEDVTSIDSVGIITARKLIDANNRLDVVGGANVDQLNLTGVSTFAGNIDANGALDVDGNTTLDNLVVAEAANIVGGSTLDQVNVTGVSTFAGTIDANGLIDADGGANIVGGATIDQANVTGVSTFGGVLKIPAVAGTNNAAYQNILHQTSAGIIDGGSGLQYHPANDQLSVNGTTITSGAVYSSGGSSLKLADANYSSTTNVLISNKVEIAVNDNVAGAFKLKEGSNEYITVDTTNSSELIKFGTASTERLRITSGGHIIAGGQGSTIAFNNVGNDSFGSVIEIDGSHTTDHHGMLSVVGKTDTNTNVVGRVQFVNSQNSSGSSGSNAGSKNVASIEGRITTGDSNAGDDSGGYLRFVTKAEAGGNAERLRIMSDGRVGIKFTGNYTMNANSTNLVIGDGGGGVGMTFWTAAGADNQTISFQTNENLSRAEGEISYGPTNTSTAADRNVMMFRTNSNERLRIDSSGDISIGNGAGYAVWNNTGNDQRPRFQLKQTAGDDRGVAFLEERGDANGMDVFISKSRGGSGTGVITSGDTIGFLKFSGADGTRQHNAAGIQCWNNGTVATGRVAGNLSFYTASDSVSSIAERLRIASTGRLLYGNHINDRGAELQYEGDQHACIGVHRNTANHGAPAMHFSASRGTSAGSNTVVQSGDYLGLIGFKGADGSDLAAGAQITAIVDGTPGSDDMPTRLAFWTSADGSQSPTERLRITSGGHVNLGTNNLSQTSYTFSVDQGTTEGNGFKVANDEVTLNCGACGSGHSYGREFVLNASRADSGSLPFLRLAGQGGIKFCVDANSERLQIDTSGRFRMNQASWTGNQMTIKHTGASPYSFIGFENDASDGWDGMIGSFDGNFGMRTDSGVDGFGIIKGASTSSNNTVFYIDNNGHTILGEPGNTLGQVYGTTSTARKCNIKLAVTGGAIGIMPLGDGKDKHGRYVHGWYSCGNSGSSTYVHLKTSLWAGGSPHGNSEYIMGGFRIKGYSYGSPTGYLDATHFFHNWSGSYPGSTLSDQGTWTGVSTIYTSTDGYVTIRLPNSSYKGYFIDLFQYQWYASRDITVTSKTYSNSTSI